VAAAAAARARLVPRALLEGCVCFRGGRHARFCFSERRRRALSEAGAALERACAAALAPLLLLWLRVLGSSWQGPWQAQVKGCSSVLRRDECV